MIKGFGKSKTRSDTHAMRTPFFKIFQDQKASALGRKGCSVREWGPQNASVKSCDKTSAGQEEYRSDSR